MFGPILRLLSRLRARIVWIREERKLQRVVTAHEAGHGLAAWLLPAFGETIFISADPAGPYRGFTLTGGLSPERGDVSAIFQGMLMSMAGIAAEALLLGEVSDGGGDDIHSVLTSWLWGSHGLSPPAAESIAGELVMDLIGEDDLRRANAEAFAGPILAAFYGAALELLTLHRKNLRKVAKALKRKRQLTSEDLARILGPRRCVDFELIYGPFDRSPS